MTIDNDHNADSQSIKESLSHFLAEQPDTVTIEEIQEFLFLKQQIMAGQKSIREGRWYSQEQVKELSAKWSK